MDQINELVNYKLFQKEMREWFVLNSFIPSDLTVQNYFVVLKFAS